MPVELVVPSFGESITEVEIGDWLKKQGEAVDQDEPVVVIETEKVTVELPAPASGTISSMLKKKGDKASIGDVIGYIETNGSRATPAPPRAADAPRPTEIPRPAEPEPRGLTPLPSVPPLRQTGRDEQIVPMTPIRRRIAQRLVEAQKSAALLTTFNQIDMSAVIALRKQHQDAFQAKYRIKLGFMSFFVKASIEALKLIPQVNAEIRGNDIVYRNYYDIGIAVGGGKGLVVPVLRSAERMSFAEVERAIADFT